MTRDERVPDDRPGGRGPGVPPALRRAGLLETVIAVLWSFLGVRKRAAHERDAAQLNPLVVIAVGVLLAVVFVLVLLAIVRAVVGA